MPLPAPRGIVAALVLAVAMLPFAARAGDDSAAAQVIAEVNAFRAAHGLAPVALESRLMQAAQDHAEAMAEMGALAHDGPDGDLTERMRRAGYAFATAAENVGAGAPTAKETVAGWIQSPRHARNLLLPSVVDAGVGHAAHPADGAHPFGDYWCLILGQPAPP